MCDAWINNQSSIEQKRKYRSLLKGYREFKTKCTIQDVDVEKALRQHITCNDDTPDIPPDSAESIGVATDKAIDTERREMKQLIELLQEGGIGYVPKRKPTGWVCLMFENRNSLGIFTRSKSPS